MNESQQAKCISERCDFTTADIADHRINFITLKTQTIMKKMVCDLCGWEYDPAVGVPEAGIAPGTPWEEVPADFVCPLCEAGKDQFSEA